MQPYDNCQNGNGSIRHTEWRFLIQRFMSYVDRKVIRMM